MAAVAQGLPTLTDGAGLFFRMVALWHLCLAELPPVVMASREAAGGEASATAGVIDSQSVKTRESGGPRGLDACKKIKGRKRHALAERDGVHPFRIQPQKRTTVSFIAKGTRSRTCSVGSKDWRRIHTRYDRCPRAFMSAVCIAAVIFGL
jgi:hypothetical protein